MVRGVSFEISQKTAYTLSDIFKTVDMEQFYWYVVQAQTETWDKPFGEDFFKKEIYSGNEFSKTIQEEHFIVFLKLQAYPCLKNFQNISVYSDFAKSDCQLILLIYDCSFVEVYAKNQAILQGIFQRASKMYCENLTYITDQSDVRTKMDIR